MTSFNDFNLINREQRKHEKKTHPKGEMGNRQTRIAFMNKRQIMQHIEDDDEEDYQN